MTPIDFAERGLIPDWLIRIGIRRMLKQRLRQTPPSSASEFATWLRRQPMAIAADRANSQHYEVHADFFRTVLGPRLKYSCCLFDGGDRSLKQAEEAMLDLTCQRAEIADGMHLLELGCGWGSLSLWMAERYPHSRITAVSNSRTQKAFIDARCRERGILNLEVVTANVAEFAAQAHYHRIVSVEMFEHLRNYETLLERVGGWLHPEGKLFVHIFCHRSLAYAFEVDGDWMARHFFTGGIMPSFDLLGHFDRDVRVSQSWFLDGGHYARTCELWLRNLDLHRTDLEAFFRNDIGAGEARLLLQRWRIFFMACAELFAFGGGQEWGVGHYLLEPTRNPVPASLAESLR